MTLEEAIEGLQDEVKEATDEGALKAVAYLQLGIEALKRVEHTRHEAPEFVIPLLPGETKESKLNESGFTEEEVKDIRHSASDDTIG